MLSQESRLENWNCLMSREIVNCWMNEESKVSQFNKFLGLLTFLNLEATDKLFQDLEAKLQEIKGDNNAQPNLEKLIYVQERFSDWYYEVYLKEINLKFQQSQIEIRDKFKKFINAFWLENSSKYALNFSSKIEKFLLSQINKYRAENQTFLQGENSVKKSYNCLTNKVIQELDGQEIQRNYDSANNALLHIFKYKIRAEISDFKIQIISAIIKDNQFIIENLLESNSFLNNLKESFLVKKQKSKLAIAEFFDEWCLLKSPHDLKQELENDLGVPLNRWGSCGYVSIEEVNKILTKKVSPITEAIHRRLTQELTSETKSNQEENNHLKLVNI